ncbi:MAG: UDP-N-acetylmuramoyl-L-alanyl-D-glutamate--2,6-diaminopimelate ligase [Lachnospiraceae bacterium]|nr:UDP-N-acetylmuramoyl-L-alanyl-D-glutamate--2,6-diaminopimelate ligase [Lachnospiraceae bacterium]
MKLDKLLSGIKYDILQGNIDIDISDVEYDSRKVKEGALFVCLSGFETDGHAYINRAHALGATAVLVEKGLEACHEAMQKKATEDGFGDTYVPCNMTVVKVDDAKKALALLSATWFGNPADRLTIIGLTGTKGKTTTAHMIKKILETAGHKTGMIGTIGTYICDEKIETKNTTPQSYELHSLFAKMVDKGCDHCVMEVSSQALKLDRTFGIKFEYGAFLNISPDHIGPGEHVDFEDYFECKKKLFSQCNALVINTDDKHGRELAGGEAALRVPSGRVYTVSTYEKADWYTTSHEDIWKPDLLGTKISVRSDEIPESEGDYIIPMPGRFNAENALIAIAICAKCGVKSEDLAEGLKNTSVKGRTQVIREASDTATFIIDYAHNALSMESLLSMLKGYKPNRLICLFGGGGNKPKQRRYDMGEAAGKYADLTILTEDNPRYEEIENINNDIIVGLNVHHGKYMIIIDRKKAIEYLIDNAKPGDIVALIGKGHETYQDVKGVKTYFSEEEIIKDYVKNRKTE